MIGDLLGRRTAELHQAFAVDTDDPAFAVEAITANDVKGWTKEAKDDVKAMLKSLASARDGLDADAKAVADVVLASKDRLLARAKAASGLKPSAGRSRIHGDYHLGQVLMVQADVMIIDFEGEPRRSLDQRRAKTSPLRDVAGMLRSIDYAAAAVLDPQGGAGQASNEGAVDRATLWREQTTRHYMEAYEAAVAGSPTHPDDPAFARALLDMFVLQKAAYEVSYELSNRPDWVAIPLRGLIALIGNEEVDA